MKKHRVLLIVRHPVGGIRTFFKYFYPRFDSSKFQFTLLAPEGPETQLMLHDLRSLDIACVLLDGGVTNGRLFREVTKLLLARDFDLVHSHGLSAAVSAALGCWLTGLPHIVTCHDMLNERIFRGISGAARKIILESVLATATRIHCVGGDARDNLLKYLRVLRLCKNKLVVIRHGIETEAFQRAKPRDLRTELGLPEDSFLIGFLGRFMSPKGFRYLVDAMEIVTSGNDLPRRPVVLTFGEDGFMREERENVKRKGLADSVKFLPFVPDVAETIKGLDVVAMPSLWEACGLLAMETLVAGVPLIGTTCIGLRQVLSDTPAAMVELGSGPALAEALLAEIRSPSLAAARKFAAEAAIRFQVAERARELEALTLEVLEAHHRRGLRARPAPDRAP